MCEGKDMTHSGIYHSEVLGTRTGKTRTFPLGFELLPQQSVHNS